MVINRVRVLGSGLHTPAQFFGEDAAPPPSPPPPGSAFANFSLNVSIKMINHVARGVGAVSNAQLCLFPITIGDYILHIWVKLRTSLRLFVDSLYIQLYHTALNIPTEILRSSQDPQERLSATTNRLEHW